MNKSFEKPRSLLLISPLCMFLCFAVYAQQPGPTPTSIRRAHAASATGPIKVDGHLDEPDWKTADVVTNFLQEEPDEGHDATELTEVRVLFDSKNIYFGIRAFDSEPNKINARELVRDAEFSNDDKVEILIDTFHDKRNAYRFAVNPLGVQQDALVTDEGRDINSSWDTSWISEGKRDEKGWTVEIAIPLTSLRFKKSIQSWGFNVARQIRRKHEETLWTAWQREYGLERVSQAGELTGVKEIRRRRLFEIKPYVSGGWRQGFPQIGSPGFDSGLRGTAGIEVARVGLTPSLTAEFTVNPDFGQAEVDQQVINLSRFSVFFPEKRDFFLENAGIFLFGREESNQPFFSRRIGLTGDGAPVPIDYGVKVTGKVGPYSLGFLQVETRKLGDQNSRFGIPRQNFTVARIKRGIFGRSYIGGIFVNRQGSPFAPASGLADASRYNRAAGLDAELNYTNHLRTYMFLMGTANPGVRSSFLSGRVDTRFENDNLRFIAVYEDIGSNFNPEVGFVERNGVRQYFGQAAFKPRPTFIPGVRSMEFETQIEYYADRAGHLATRQTELSWDTVFTNGADAFFRPIEYVADVLKEPFEIRPGIVIPRGAYYFNRPRISFSSDSSKKVVFSGRYKWGGFYSGELDEVSGGITYRPNMHMLFDFSNAYNNARLRQGNFSTNLFAGRMNYNFSRKLLTSALVQLNSAAKLSLLNVRFRYIYRPNSDIYVIYNQSTGAGLERPSYSLQIKMTYDLTF